MGNAKNQSSIKNTVGDFERSRDGFFSFSFLWALFMGVQDLQFL